MNTRPPKETSPDRGSVAVLPDAESLVLAAATTIIGEARRAVSKTGRFTIALSGGDTPRPVYELLAKPAFATLFPWNETHVFWGDERCVDREERRSNEAMARHALLDHVPIPSEQIHPMMCVSPQQHPGGARETDSPRVAGAVAAEPASREAVARQAADEYERLLREFFGEGPPAGNAAGIDLVLLGLGENGHTASLFPGSDLVEEQQRWVAAAREDPMTAAATSGTGERLWRVTLTASFINQAGFVLFVVGGASKALVMKEVLEGDEDPHSLPARAIRPGSSRLVWLLDEAAAFQLSEGVRESAPAGAIAAPTSSAARELGPYGAPAAPAPPAQPGPGAPTPPVAPPLPTYEPPMEPESFDDLPECGSGPSR
jgi:6-phosphogluconolactonase